MDFSELIQTARQVDERRATHYNKSLEFLRDVIKVITEQAAQHEVRVEPHWDQKLLAQRATTSGGVWVTLTMHYSSPKSEYSSGQGTVPVHLGIRAHAEQGYDLLISGQYLEVIYSAEDAVEPVIRAAQAVLVAKKNEYLGV